MSALYEKKEQPDHLENVLSNDTDFTKAKHHQSLNAGVDAEVAKYLNSGVVIDEAANKRVLRLVSPHGARAERPTSRADLLPLPPYVYINSSTAASCPL